MSELQRGGALQRRTVLVLSLATILGGLGAGATLSVGALLIAEVSGIDAVSGLSSAAFNTGAALAGIPLARLAYRWGRRFALVTGSTVAMVGAIVAVFSTVIGQWGLLVFGLIMLGVASAVQLQSRFTATDLAAPGKRARDLSLVVWSITVGAVVGPNLLGPGAWIGGMIGVTPLAGVFVFAFFAQVLAALVNWIGLRPDPLLTARELPPEHVDIDRVVGEAKESALVEGGDRPMLSPRSIRRAQILIIFAIAIAQAIMVGLMAMTPLHLMHHEGTPELVGFTLSLHIAGMYALSPVFGMLASRFGSVRVIWLGWALLLISIVIAYFSGASHLLVQIAMTVLGLGWGAVTVAGAALLTPTSVGLILATFPPEGRGGAVRLWAAIGGFAAALGPIVGRVVSELVLDGQPSIDLRKLRYSRFKEKDIAPPRSTI